MEKALQSDPSAFSRGKRKLIENKSSLEIAGICLWENGGVNFVTARGTDGRGEGGTAKPERGDPGQTVSPGDEGSGPASPACPGSHLAPAGTAEPGKASPRAPIWKITLLGWERD